MGISIPTLVKRARDQLSQITHLTPASTLEVFKLDGGWRVSIEMVEKKSIPDGMDVLGTYELRLDEQGNLIEFSRKKLRRRMDTKVEE